MANKKVDIYTDGSCKGNPGDGGYCAILKQGEYEKVVRGYIPNTTNNQMELLAVIAGLRALKIEKGYITIYSDSKYVCDAFNNGWLEAWKKSNWIKSDKKPVKNKELWQELVSLCYKQNSVTFSWVKGHADEEYNNKCDQIAQYMASHHCMINGELMIKKNYLILSKFILKI